MNTALEIIIMIILGTILGCLLAGWPFYPL